MGGGTRWTDALFDQLQAEGDLGADAVIKLHAAGGAVPDAKEFVKGIAHNPVLPWQQRSKPIDDYLNEQPSLPKWTCQDKLDRSAMFFEENGLLIGMSLFCASLPEAYSAARGARVLGLTSDLVTNPVRRIYETAQMLFDALSTDDGLHPGKKGYGDIRRVRLMHAAVRYLVLNDEGVKPPWDLAQGLPINQEDMFGTLMTFTQIVFEALKRMGVEPSHDDKAAYLHTWCVAGHLMGIRADLLPLTVEDAEEITKAIRRRQRRPGEDAKELGTALVGAMQRSVSVAPLKVLPPALVRWHVGRDVAEINGIKGHESLDRVFKAIGSLTRLLRVEAQQERFVAWLLRGLSGHVSRVALKGFVDAGREGRPNFELPRKLQQQVRYPLPRWRLKLHLGI